MKKGTPYWRHGAGNVNTSLFFRVGDLSASFDRIWAVSPEKGAIQSPRLVNLADCANIYAAVLSLNPKSVRKLTEIYLCYIRDSVSNGALSLIDDSANLSDVGAKSDGNVTIFFFGISPNGALRNFFRGQKRIENPARH